LPALTRSAQICGHRGRLERLAASLDGMLDAREQRRMREHRRACRWCRRVAAEASALLAALDAGQAHPGRPQV
jgi:hypothetical protein